MSRRTERILVLVYTLLIVLSFGLSVDAMHIIEGYLPATWCVAWGALCLPSLFFGLKKIDGIVKKNKQAIILLAMAGAFTFVLSSLKLPSVTGSSSHMTGLGFAAILFGPAVSSILSVIVLLFQALLLAHGGLTTLGANTFSMGIIGPIIAFAIFTWFSKLGIPKRVTIFFAAFFGDLSTYVVTSFQLGIAHHEKTGSVLSSCLDYMAIFGIAQIPLAIIEGILTVVLINMVSAYGKDLLSGMGKDVLKIE